MKYLLCKWALDKFGIAILGRVYKMLVKNKLYLLCIIMGCSSTMAMLYYNTSVKRKYVTLSTILTFQDVTTQQKKYVQRCNTQNCLGIGQVETMPYYGKSWFHKKKYGVRFAQIWCKDKAGGEVFELTHIPNHWYSNQHLRSISKKNDLYSLLELVDTNEIMGVEPMIAQNGDKCYYDMFLLKQKHEKEILYTGKEVFDRINIKVPFFTEQVFPNLNTQCNPRYSALYSETAFTKTWLTHYNKQYFVWWSFAKEGTCDGMQTQEDIFLAIQDLSTTLGNNYM